MAGVGTTLKVKDVLTEYNKLRSRYARRPTEFNRYAYDKVKEKMKRARRIDDDGRRQLNAEILSYISHEDNQRYYKNKLDRFEAKGLLEEYKDGKRRRANEAHQKKRKDRKH